MESTGLFIWLILAPILLLCEGIVGIYLIAAGIKYRKSLIVVPIICIGYGIDLEGMVPISGTLYWCFFSLAGLVAIISGRQISSIRSMGTILVITGLCSVTSYHLLYLTT
ncbi:ammonia permease [Bacillus toyonensis]|uniref:ammonia permease n=1 Tax=Bacillus toyonensis TaxID=155322 RepID=UPI000BEC48EF|nr:ammonia permease [Bacillus toyonensis]PED17808.1 ammonia permease [Bacillus toyonensis]PGB36810.1 ammonia permease [Bacillus toyonensis]PHC99952.1 ammonia permease [Bacillus toyonensis]